MFGCHFIVCTLLLTSILNVSHGSSLQPEIVDQKVNLTKNRVHGSNRILAFFKDIPKPESAVSSSFAQNFLTNLSVNNPVVNKTFSLPAGLFPPGITRRQQQEVFNKFIDEMKNKRPIKIYGDGTESKFPPFLEFLVQRIQSYFSVYKYEDMSRPAYTFPDPNIALGVHASEPVYDDVIFEEDTSDFNHKTEIVTKPVYIYQILSSQDLPDASPSPSPPAEDKEYIQIGDTTDEEEISVESADDTSASDSFEYGSNGVIEVR